MHVALIIDQERLLHEQAMLHHASVGLTAQGAQLTSILPELTADEAPAVHPPVEASRELAVRMKVPPWMRRPRAHELASALEGGLPDLVHAVGEQAWTVGLDLARAIDRPVTLDVWSADQAHRAPHNRATSHVAGYIAPNEPIADTLRQRVDPDLVTVVPFGVELPDEPRPVPDCSQEVISLAIIGSGQEPAEYQAMLTALSGLTKEMPRLHACLELRGPCEHEIWRQARRLDLLGRISPIVDAALHQPLLTGCDVLVIPERLGQVRSLILHAMALGMPVVAGDDPYLDMLVPDETALIVSHPEADEWADQLRAVLTQSRLRFPRRLAIPAGPPLKRTHPSTTRPVCAATTSLNSWPQNVPATIILNVPTVSSWSGRTAA